MDFIAKEKRLAMEEHIREIVFREFLFVCLGVIGAGLALWKLVDILIWVLNHVNVEFI